MEYRMQFAAALSGSVSLTVDKQW